MKEFLNRTIAKLLVVAIVFANSSFSTFADSVEQMVYTANKNKQQTKNYYYLYQEEKIKYQNTTYYADGSKTNENQDVDIVETNDLIAVNNTENVNSIKDFIEKELER